MRALILDSSRKDDTVLEIIRTALVEQLQQRAWTVHTFLLRDGLAVNCAACLSCWMNSPGVCVREGDLSAEVADMVVQSDLLVLLTPVTFGGYSSALKRALERLIPNVLSVFQKVGEPTRPALSRPHYPSLLAIGTLKKPVEDSMRFFEARVSRTAANFFSPLYAAGIIVGAPEPDEVRQEIQGLLSQVDAG